MQDPLVISSDAIGLHRACNLLIFLAITITRQASDHHRVRHRMPPAGRGHHSQCKTQSRCLPTTYVTQKHTLTPARVMDTLIDGLPLSFKRRESSFFQNHSERTHERRNERTNEVPAKTTTADQPSVGMNR